jgi:hypothetical protein
MADAGDLEKLPLELRKQVYAHLFVESKNIAISRYRIGPGKQVARSDNRRDCIHRGEIFDPHQDKRVTAPPGITLLLLVNKVLNQEDTEAFYGLNGFEFPDSDVLKCFLGVIGSSRQHVHRLAFVGRGVLQRYNWKSTDRSIELLKQAGGLRSLEISHATFCGDGYLERQTWSTRSLAMYPTSLLESLQATFDEQSLNISICDLIKVMLPPCVFDSYSADSHMDAHASRCNPGRLIALNDEELVCRCVCAAAEHKNKTLAKSLRKKIICCLA